MNQPGYLTTLFETQTPMGDLGRGTHYSVYRAIVWHDDLGKSLALPKYHDFAVIWDEDHDERIFEAIDLLYVNGLLSLFLVMGERKGNWTGLVDIRTDNFALNTDLYTRLRLLLQSLEDPWGMETSVFPNPWSLIHDDNSRVRIFLNGLDATFRFGLKPLTANCNYALGKHGLLFHYGSNDEIILDYPQQKDGRWNTISDEQNLRCVSSAGDENLENL